jgi:ABC-2 type transport system ATP-binding protein
MELTGRMYGMSLVQIEEKTDPLMKLVGMDRWTDTKLRKYSKGMLQRVGLAQAMINDPDILLLDEPTDGVDPVGKAEIKEVLIKTRNEGKTIILNSHLLSEVEAVADRVAILSRGRLAKISRVDELTTSATNYEIDANIGSHLVEIPDSVGRILLVSSSKLIVELTEPVKINQVIDHLRLKRIDILSLKPMKVTLEQSFLETIAAAGEKQV